MTASQTNNKLAILVNGEYKVWEISAEDTLMIYPIKM